MKQQLICIVCPKGCHLTAEQTAEGWQISGFGCPRGQQYGIAEMTNPTRVVTSTVRITGGIHPRLPVKTDGALPRSLVRDAVRMLDTVEVAAPVACGQVILAAIGGSGINYVASRDMYTIHKRGGADPSRFCYNFVMRTKISLI